MNCFKFDDQYPAILDVLILIVILGLMVWLNVTLYKKLRAWYSKMHPFISGALCIFYGGIALLSAVFMILGLIRMVRFFVFFVRVYMCDGWI